MKIPIHDTDVHYLGPNSCLVQFKSYHLVVRFPESFALQQKSALYAREAKQTMETVDMDDEINGQNADLFLLTVHPTDLCTLTESQTRLKQEILKDWYDSRSNGVPDEQPIESNLSMLCLAEDQAKTDLLSTAATNVGMLDVAYNYVINFPTPQIAVAAGHAQNSGASIRSASFIPTASVEEPTPEPKKKSGGGLWSFFTGQ